eukprot:TRINITY_DN2936_c0_g1_i9.p3 TRINITY_DN2936_c0_g1~~TRINITY_DN2936_c0_g1_i9.p3  ORF type:complete len:183 (+),score=33.72 TRINITY_DN2936_c0_g1_i9:152-700(+)
MGNAVSSIWKLFQARDVRGLIMGIDAAGKTTLLYKLKLGEVVTTVPTIGFNVETVEYQGLKFTMWDCGGGEKLRALHCHYYASTEAIVWVVDSNDRDRIGWVREELEKALNHDELRDIPLLVFANKQDLPTALSPEEVTDKLGLRSVARDWYVQPACATTGEGIYEGFEWLSTILKASKKSW